MNTGPPVFVSTLEDQVVNATATLNYTLPEIEDPDSDDFTLDVNLQTATLFTTYNATTRRLLFAPKMQHVSAKPYPIKLTLSDNNETPKSKTYTLNVLVQSPYPAPPSSSAV